LSPSRAPVDVVVGETEREPAVAVLRRREHASTEDRALGNRAVRHAHELEVGPSKRDEAVRRPPPGMDAAHDAHEPRHVRPPPGGCVQIAHGPHDVVHTHVRSLPGYRGRMLRYLSLAVSTLVATVVAAALVATSPGAAAQDAPATPWVAGVSFPTNLAFAPDGRLFFTEKETGTVRIVEPGGRLRPAPFFRARVQGGGETGMLGIALHPRFADGEPWVYVYLSDADTAVNRIVRIRADGAEATGDPQVLLDTVPATNAYHNGGDLVFGPDAMLYATVGEAHERERAHDLDDLGGKVLRLTPDGAPAPGNPFGDANAAFTTGHRNSFGICVDPATGELWATENGPDRDDEVNRLRAGADYGWPDVTGDSDGRFEDPVTVFADPVALTGCAWWGGALHVGAFNDGKVYRIDTATGDREPAFAFPAGVTDLVSGPGGALYVATTTDIWRIEAATSPTPTAFGSPLPPVTPDTGAGPIRWVSIVAAIVLAGALGARLAAGRTLRRGSIPRARGERGRGHDPDDAGRLR